MTGTDAATRARTEAAAVTRGVLLRCHLRERGVRVTAPGPVALDGPGLVADVTHASRAGHHRFGPAVRRATGEALDHDAVVAALLGDDPRGVADVVADSTARTARHLAAAGPWPPDDVERALLRGHPFHPTAKSAEGFDDTDLAAYAPEQGAAFRCHRLEVDPDLLVGAGDGPLAGPALPVHPWQASYLARTPEVAALLDAGRLRFRGPHGPVVTPTSSVRTVTGDGHVWKLPLHVRLTHFVRTNPLDHVRRALDASALVARLRGGWPDVGFGVLTETGWRGVDAAAVGPERAADLAVLVREPPPAGCWVLAGLLEEGPRGEEPALMAPVRRVGAAPWLRRHLAIATVPMLRAFDVDGVGFEAHVQNSMLACADGWPVAFRVRDMEGVHVDRRRVAPGLLDPASPALYDPDEAWQRVRYHQVVNHLSHLVATLGYFSDVDEDALWAVVAAELAAAGTPSATALTRDRTLPAKANLASRLGGRGETPDYVEIPNPIRECAAR